MARKAVLVTIHGQESVGKNMALLSGALDKEVFMDDCIFINLRYTKLWTIVNTLPWVRTMTAKYIAARLAYITLKHPTRRIIAVTHSNGCRATRIAMDMRLKPKKKWPQFRIDNLVLLGCPIKRNYKWSRHPFTRVVNFVSTNDKVVWLARFYGMGSAGRFGFKYRASNLEQKNVRWGHSGFMEFYPKIKQVIKDIILWRE